MADGGELRGWRMALRALRHRNFQLFAAGQFISLIGTWMQMIALPWLVYSLDPSAWWLGMIGFVGRIPSLIFTPFAGVLVDRFNRHRMVVVAQVLSMFQAFVLAGLTLAGHITKWELLVLAMVLGLINAFEMPSRQALLVELVDDRDDLSNAIALQSSMFNSARLLGPAITGVLLAFHISIGMCFLLNGLSFLAVIWGLLAMKLPRIERRVNETKVLAGLAEGLRYAWETSSIRTVLLLISLVSLLGTPYMVLLPKYASETLHTGPTGYGLMMGAAGVGALTGAIYLAARRTVVGLERVMPLATVIFSLGLVFMAGARSISVACVLMVITGGSMMVQMASGNTLIQTVVDDDKRGRVMSLHILAFMGTAPFGSLMAGALGDRIGVSATILLGGLVSLLAGLWFFARRRQFSAQIRPAYVAKGLLPPPYEEALNCPD
jgi:MFS family permease